jgi:lipopolysaccharide/colanic/teichoic acid biosynthesis glycosyltransferase
MSFILPYYRNPFSIYLVIWLAISLIMGKYNLAHFKKPIHLIVSITLITFTILSIVSIILFALKLNKYSRIIVFGTILLSYIAELIAFRIFYGWLRTIASNYNKFKQKRNHIIEIEHSSEIIKEELKLNNFIKKAEAASKEQIITKESGPDVYNYFSEHLKMDSKSVYLTSTANPFNIENLNGRNLPAIINLRKINDFKHINKFFEAVNRKLCDAGTFIGAFETNRQRELRISKRIPIFIRQFIVLLDFIINRIIPEIPGISNLYFSITKGLKQSISKAEVLGRLVSCGFEIIEYKEINNLTYFVTLKTGEPSYNQETSYGYLFKMPRIGIGGKVFYIYKFRTMYPYSEYLQDYVLRLNGYSQFGKPAEDFRLTFWGKFLRKYWLDELPQLINVLSGEMKLVGFRPLSLRAYEDYPEDVKSLRANYKPGCIPPYVSLLKQGMSESIEAERTYLIEKEKSPFYTDLKYFRLAVVNIITNKIRSA